MPHASGAEVALIIINGQNYNSVLLKSLNTLSTVLLATVCQIITNVQHESKNKVYTRSHILRPRLLKDCFNADGIFLPQKYHFHLVTN